MAAIDADRHTQTIVQSLHTREDFLCVSVSVHLNMLLNQAMPSGTYLPSYSKVIVNNPKFERDLQSKSEFLQPLKVPPSKCYCNTVFLKSAKQYYRTPELHAQ